MRPHGLAAPTRLISALLLLLLAVAGPARAQGLVREPIDIPATYRTGEKAMLEALVVRPAGPGRFPLAVMTHGAPRDRGEVRRRTPQGLLAQATEFARRGWATVVVMRRGYGASEGDAALEYNSCKTPAYEASGRRGADDLREAIRFMGQQPYVDARRVIGIGVSAGGLVASALTADPPPGLVAAISFAGGRGSTADHTLCAEDALVDTFGVYGRTSRVPMLWVYAQNDRYFEPRVARRFHAAFTANGGRAAYVEVPPFGEDGHTLFTAGIPVWTPIIDRFLAENRLQPPPARISQAPPPPALGAAGRESYDKYLAAPPNKAFVASGEGAYGWRSGRRSEDEARAEALDACRKHAKQPCRVVNVNDRPE